MRGSHSGALVRRVSLVAVFMLVMLALATHVTVARAATSTIAQTAITSPGDSSDFQDPPAATTLASRLPPVGPRF